MSTFNTTGLSPRERGIYIVARGPIPELYLEYHTKGDCLVLKNAMHKHWQFVIDEDTETDAAIAELSEYGDGSFESQAELAWYNDVIWKRETLLEKARLLDDPSNGTYFK